MAYVNEIALGELILQINFSCTELNLKMKDLSFKFGLSTSRISQNLDLPSISAFKRNRVDAQNTAS